MVLGIFGGQPRELELLYYVDHPRLDLEVLVIPNDQEHDGRLRRGKPYLKRVFGEPKSCHE